MLFCRVNQYTRLVLRSGWLSVLVVNDYTEKCRQQRLSGDAFARREIRILY